VTLRELIDELEKLEDTLDENEITLPVKVEVYTNDFSLTLEIQEDVYDYEYISIF